MCKGGKRAARGLSLDRRKDDGRGRATCLQGSAPPAFGARGGASASGPANQSGLVSPVGLAYNPCMSFAPLLAAVADTNAVVAKVVATAAPGSASSFGVMFWVLMMVSAAAVAVVVERVLYFHRVQIDSAQILAGVRNVLRRDNVIEALSICDATRGPVARLVKAAILNRDSGRARVEEVIEEIGQVEVPRLEHNLPRLATVAQVSPLLGLMGTLFGFAAVFRELRRPDGVAYGYAAPGQMFDGLMQSLYAAALGIGIAAFCYAAYNYLVHRVNLIVLDMERASREAVRLTTGETDILPLNGGNHGGGGSPGGRTP